MIKNQLGVITSSLIILFFFFANLGCIGTESRTNLSIKTPEVVEVLGNRVETLVVELSPDEADAKNVIINLSAPAGISLTDPHTYIQQYNKEFQKIPRG